METIGWAVKQMHHGEKVRRTGWNGKGMFLVLRPGSVDTVSDETAHALDTVNPVTFDPYVMMRTATGSYVPWLCSQTDLLATDWEIAAA